MRAKYLPDDPVVSFAEDVLGLDRFAGSVHDAVVQAQSPYVFGVYGDWGVGKTSTMRLLELALNQHLDDGVAFDVPIWINIWKFENEANLLYPILHALKEDFHRRLPPGATEALQKRLVKVVGSSLVAFADLGLRAVTKKFTGEAIKLEDVKDHMTMVESELGAELEGVLSRWAAEVTRLPTLYAEFIAAYAEQLGHKHSVAARHVRFVFLIDDLDRCLPDNVIAVLERIKNFLSVQGCIYVLGVNPYVVQQGIRAKFSTVDVDGREYLEKIVNHSFHVPEPQPARLKTFASQRLAALLDPPEAKRMAPRLEAFGRVLAECGFANPRKIKRILNRYLAFLARHGGAGEAWRDDNIVRLLVMAEYFPELFRIFATDAAGAKKALLALGDGSEDFAQFEAHYGVSLGMSRERIAALRGLFDLQAAAAPGQPDVAQHVAAVAEFTRLR